MTNPIRAALERLLSDIQDLSDSSQGIVGLHRNGDPAPWNELLEGGRYSSWLGDAIAAARLALAKRDPLRKHCTEILQLWDADCDIDGAMEHLRGLLSEEVQP